jgi:hypothetical protein
LEVGPNYTIAAYNVAAYIFVSYIVASSDRMY